jgi:hypothetical protein
MDNTEIFGGQGGIECLRLQQSLKTLSPLDPGSASGVTSLPNFLQSAQNGILHRLLAGSPSYR